MREAGSSVTDVIIDAIKELAVMKGHLRPTDDTEHAW